ncbi:cadherin domain-containing protein [Vibrio sp. SCSIO 43137]|uniref:cadherin domain-containing protein n=1 Tax=Vibrio sp. SCSIO 43137 TaxID=3021011 RepID=UPI002307620F|nr:cadherin domain-containing protein [Vibrio sp. SCSIO 43137]WCE31245.1 cadherin domain-containing protein [Vibrio sp. SCSIO 43137]
MTGKNDAAVVSEVTAERTEDADEFRVNLLENSSDADTSDVLSVSDVTPVGEPKGVTVDGGELIVDPNAYNYLAAGEKAVIKYTYNVLEKDDEGNLIATHPTTATITITGTNDAPTSTVDIIEINEDTTVALTLNDFGNYNDVENEALAEIQITDLPDAGKLEYKNAEGKWVAVTEGQVFSANDISEGRLQYTPASNASGDDHAQIGFKVGDGKDFSEDSYQLTVNVTPVADQAVLTTGNLGKIIEGSQGDAADNVMYDTGSDAKTYYGNEGVDTVVFKGDFKDAEIEKHWEGKHFSVDTTEGGHDYVSTDIERLQFDDGVYVRNDAGEWVKEVTAGDEDTAISLNINVGLADTDGSESISSILIKDVPKGAKLSAGTDNEDGTWTLTPAQLKGLTITPPEHSDKNFDLQVVVTTQEGNDAANTAVVSKTLSIEVNALADEAELTVKDASGDEDTAIALDITTALTDKDGSETLSVTIKGVPAGAVLSAGTDNKDGTWTLTSHELKDLTITPPHNSGEDFVLTVEVTTTETNGGDKAVVSETLNVSVNPVADAPVVTTGASDTTITAGNHGDIGNVVANDVMYDTGKDATTYYGYKGNDTVVFKGDFKDADIELHKQGNHYSVDTKEGGHDYVSTDIERLQFDDGVYVRNGAGEWVKEVTTGDEDSAISLNITAGLTDTDNSESISSIVIKGVPQGALLSAGTDNKDGTWTLTSDDLKDLTITPPHDSDKDFDLTVEVTTQETDGGDTAVVSKTLSIEVSPVADPVNFEIVPNEGWSQTIDFDNIKFSGGWTSRGNANAANTGQTDVTWGTNNSDNEFEVGLEKTYKGGSSTNTVMELEGGANDKTFTADFKAEPNEVIEVKFDISARSLPSNNDTQSDANLKLVYIDKDGVQQEKLLYVFDPSDTSWSTKNVVFAIPEDAKDGSYKLVFESADLDTSSTVGALIDDVTVSSLANTGYEGTPIKVNEIKASLQDTDTSEDLVVKLTGLPKGAVISDGTKSVTADGTNPADISELDLSKLTINVADSGNYTVGVIAHSVESDNTKGPESTGSFKLDVLDANDAPEFASDAMQFSYNENTAAGVELAKVEATDKDDLNDVTYTITGGNSNKWFQIDSKTGAISLTVAGANAAANDFEDAQGIDSHSLIITATDSKGGVAQQKVTLNESNVDESGSFNAQTVTYAENQVENAVVGSVSGSDLDGVSNYQFKGANGSLSNTSPDGFYTIDANGDIRITAAGVSADVNDFEKGGNSGDYQVVMTDGYGSKVEATVTLKESNVDESGSFNAQTVTYAENQVENAVVGSVSGSDLDGVSNYQFKGANGSLSNTSADGFYTIDANGDIRITAAGVSADVNDFEKGGNSGDYQVVMTDGYGSKVEATVTLKESNVDESGSFNAQTVTYAENQVENAVVGSVSGNDLDGVSNYQFKGANGSLSNTSPDGFYTIDANGDIRITAAGVSADVNDFEKGGNSGDYQVVMTDGYGSKVEATVTLKESNVDESGSFNAQTVTYAENQVENAVVGSVSGNDLDGVSNYQFKGANGSLSNTSPDGFYTIDANGDIRITAAGVSADVNDFEKGGNSGDYQVVMTDGYGSKVEATVTLKESNVDESGSFNAQTVTYAENQVENAVVGSVSGNDLDGVSNYQFKGANGSLSNTSPDGFYTIDANGDIRITAAGVSADVNDFEKGGNSGDYQVVMTDGYGSKVEATVTLKESNVNEKPTIDLNGSETKVTFLDENGAFVSAVGYYTLDKDGNPTDPVLLSEGLNRDVTAKGTVLAEGIDVPIEELHFFIIADADHSVTGNLSFSGTTLVDNNGVAISKPVYFDQPELNSDKKDHFKIVKSNGGSTLEVNIEDLPNLGDADFADVLLRIESEPASAIDYTNHFKEGNSDGVSIVDTDVSIKDVDGDALQSVQVKLDNPQNGDKFTIVVDDDFPAGVVIKLGTGEDAPIAVSNTIDANQTIVITNVDGGELLSHEVYEQALKAIRFQSDSQNPDESPRSIDITVIDEHGGKATATSTITVEAVNDAPETQSSPLNVNEEALDTPLNISAPTDAENDNLTITVTNLPSMGTIKLNGEPVAVNQVLSKAELTQLVYDAPDEVATNSSAGAFSYSVYDGDKTVFDSVDVTVNAVNDNPTNSDFDVKLNSGNSAQFSFDKGQSDQNNISDVEDDNSGAMTSVVIESVGKYGSLYHVVDGKTVELVEDDVVTGIKDVQFVLNSSLDEINEDLSFNSLSDFSSLENGETDSGVVITAGTSTSAVPFGELESKELVLDNGKTGLGVKGGKSTEIDVLDKEVISIDYSNADAAVKSAELTFGSVAAHYSQDYISSNGTWWTSSDDVRTDAQINVLVSQSDGSSKLYTFSDTNENGNDIATVIHYDSNGIQTAITTENVGDVYDGGKQFKANITADDGLTIDEFRIFTTQHINNGADINSDPTINSNITFDSIKVTNAEVVDEVQYRAVDSNGLESVEVATVKVSGQTNPVSGGDSTDSDSDASNHVDTITVNGKGLHVHHSATANENGHVFLADDPNYGVDKAKGNKFEDGDNHIDVGAGGDYVESGTGNDTIYLGESSGGTSVDHGKAETYLADFAQNGSISNSGLKGHSDAVDYADAGSGNDTVYGEEGTDIIFGGSGNDTLVGGSGNDGLHGGSGNDTLDGGLGNDILVGGSGADTFVWTKTSVENGTDTITDFSKAEGDKIDLSDLLGEGESVTDLLADVGGIVKNGDDLEIHLDADHGNNQTIVIDHGASTLGVDNQSDGALDSSIVNGLLDDLFIQNP